MHEEIIKQAYSQKNFYKDLHPEIVSKIISYLDAFVIQHSQALSNSIGEDTINPQLCPNGWLTDYEEALSNVLTYSGEKNWLPMDFPGEENVSAKEI